MDPKLYTAYRFFHEHAAYVVGHSAETAMRLARAEIRAQEEGLCAVWRDEEEAWDGDCPATSYLEWCAVYRGRGASPLASLGMIGTNSYSDPYRRVVEAELFAEALDEIDHEREIVASAEAESLAARPTYAMNV